MNVQVPLTAMVAPESAIVFAPVMDSVPPQTVNDALTTVMPACNVSLNATPVSASVLAAGFVIVKPRNEVALSAIVAGVNDFAMIGGASTAILAEAVKPVPPSVEAIAVVTLL